jgi:hypothetical protein
MRKQSTPSPYETPNDKMLHSLNTNLKIANIEYADWQDKLAKNPLSAMEMAEDAIQTLATIKAITTIKTELENTGSIAKALDMAADNTLALGRYVTVSSSVTRGLVDRHLTAAYAQIVHNYKNFRPGARKVK